MSTTENSEPKDSASLKERQRLRREGKINQPIKGVRGLNNLVAEMTGLGKKWTHPIDCLCAWCLPADMRPMMAAVHGMRVEDLPPEDSAFAQKPTQKRTKRPTPTNQQPKGHKAKKGLPTPRKKWTDQRGRSSN